MRTCTQHAVRGFGRAWGIFFCDASIVMTLDPETFRKIFFGVKVSEDLLDNTERIIVDESAIGNRELAIRLVGDLRRVKDSVHRVFVTIEVLAL